MTQIRIYYESLEQGANYIKPIIDKVSHRDMETILIRRPKSSKELNDGSIAALLTMITPDILITAVQDNKEYPLALIEFSEAVSTEDHELQRTNGAFAAYMSGSYYIKIAGNKKSSKIFGGAEYNPYSTPKIFLEKFGYEGYIIANWETESNNNFILKRDKNYPSCPPKIDLLFDTIQILIKAFLTDKTDWYNLSCKLLKSKKSYSEYRSLVERAYGTSHLIKSWEQRQKINLNKVRYFVQPKFIAAKINRFSHAMDPDRGILTFMSFMFSEDYKIFGIYALVRQHGNDVIKQNMTNLSLMRKKLDIALEMDKGGIPEWLVNAIRNAANKAKALNEKIDFQSVWERHLDEIKGNRVAFTLAYCLDGIKLNYNGITLVWDKRKLLDADKKYFISAFTKYFKFSTYSAPTNIEEIIEEVNEDEVTYALIHRVLKPNQFKIVSVSYPGSQGSGSVLPNSDLGKAQPREYPDVIALSPNKTNIDAILNESKGMFSQSSVEKDVSKLRLYKSDNAHKQALKETLLLAQVIDKNQNIRNITIGVSFGIKSKTETTWHPADVDFIFRVVDRKKWSIGIFKQVLRNDIAKIEGKTNFPKIYKCNK